MASRDARSPPEPGWVLALTLAAPGLTCFLTDSRSRFEHAQAPWPPAAGALALPAPILRAIADGDLDAVRLQLDADLDAWNWEAELEQARPGLRVARHLGPLAPAQSPVADASPLGTDSASDPSWVHGPAGDWRPLAATLQARESALLVVAADVSAERASRFRAALVGHWGAIPWLAAAAVRAAADTGLQRGDWRLYGDARFAAAADAPIAEWRQVSSLSIDLIQSTGLLHAWGAERYAESHSAFYLLCRRVVEDLHGRVDDPQGDDGLMAYFGLQQAREDDVARAVRAAWALTLEAPGVGFGVRIGMTTGRVAVSDGLPFGAVIHLAARLQRLAPPNGIVISADSHALLGPGVVCEPLPDRVTLAGFDTPQQAYRVVDLVSAQAARWQRLGQGRFVGRRRELAALAEAWRLARIERRGQYRCVIGEPGMGKTRLLQEFERELRGDAMPFTLLRVTGHLDLQSSAFAALALALRGTAHLDLIALLESAPSAGGSAAADSYDRTELLVRMVGATLRLARQHALCLVVDDAQWLDPSTIEFVERLHDAAASQPVLLVVGLREEARGLLRGLDTQQGMTLAALDQDESLDLIGALSASAPLPDEVRSLIASRAGGIPLFLEETVRMVDQLESDAAALAHGIPATLEDLLTARLDALGQAKPVAQLAAVLGSEFPMSLWEAVVAEPDALIERARAPAAWQRLVDTGMLVVVGSDAPRCRFRHALIRDSAYESLWSRDRKRLHGRVARVLQRHAVHGGTALRAHHLAAAGELDAAFAAWAQAAREAAASGADREALLLSQRALGLLQDLPMTPDLRQQALQLHLLQAARAIALDGYGAPSVESAYLRAAALCSEDDAGSMRLRIDLGLEACYAMRGDLARARALAEAALRSTPLDGNLRLALQARWAWTNVVFHQGDLVQALAMANQCLALYAPALHRPGAVQDPAVMFLCYRAWGLFQQGDAAEARRCIEQGLALARTLAHPFSIAVTHGFAASIAMFCGDHREGLEHAEEAMRRCSDKAFQAWHAHAQVMRGRLRAALGDTNAGIDDMEEGLARWTATGARITAATYLALQAEVWLDLGQPELARQKIVLAQDIAQRHGERYYEAELLRLRGWTQWQLRAGAAEAQAARAILQQGLDLARAQGNLGLALRGALALARTWADDGEAARAAALLSAALDAVPGQADTLDARTARAALRDWAGSDSTEHTTPP